MQFLVSKYATFKIENGILYTTYHPRKIIDESIMNNIISVCREFSNGVWYPNIIDGNSVDYITKGARKLASETDNLKGIISIAFVINNPVTRILAKAFQLGNRPLIPTELFKNFEEAQEWSLILKKKFENNIHELDMS